MTDCFTIEFGYRGFGRNRTRNWLRMLGVGKNLQTTVKKASHWIWLKSEDKTWRE